MTPVIARRIARKVFTLQGGVDIENGNIQGAEEERLE